MKEEVIDILTKNGETTGETALKSDIHKKGYYHNTAHVWLFTNNGEILLQQRSKSKLIYPLLWDVSVAGHIDAGETINEGTLREMKEEIGLILNEDSLTKIGVFDCFKSYDNGIIDNEFHHTFIAELNTCIHKLTPQKEEVEALKLVSIKEFEFLLKNSSTNGHFVASNYDYYCEVLKYIKLNLAQL
ncbi:NUDIX domain-containing protein [Aurantibacter sp.]|uniref:NUDIX hydrolase n=1 Tax=Aurantibacter sp. TaxID=2807103 RepID=UPI0035C7B4B1